MTTSHTDYNKRVTKYIKLEPTYKFIEAYYLNNVSNLKFKKKKFSIISDIKYILSKKFIKQTNTKISYDENKNILAIETLDNILNLLLINTKVDGINNILFGPIIYYRNPNIIKIGRILIYKNNDINKYLVHRSKSKNNPLNHPGGRIEYLEIFNSNLKNIKIYSAHIYLKLIINKFYNNIIMNNILNIDINNWILAGTIREVYEESGLNLNKYWDNINLIKTGRRTYYFSVKVKYNEKENGPLKEFSKEIYKVNKSNIDNTYFSNNYFNVLTKNNRINNKTKLDLFWNSNSNRNTRHAWLSKENMLKYWDKRYISHIKLLLDNT